MSLTHTHRLLDIMAALRNPDSGCPWDVKQNFQSIAPYAVEEAYEVLEAAENNDMPALREELGDLLLQVVFHAQMAREEELFSFEDVAETLCNKLVSRHPHVFADASLQTAEEQATAWEAAKALERKAKQIDSSVLADVPLALPALLRAQKLQKRAARVGFDWTDSAPVFAKIEEEITELKEAVQWKQPEADNVVDRIYDEMGDVLFSVVNLARHLHMDPEEALRRSNRKFESRFRYIEQVLEKSGRTPEQSTLEEMDLLWKEAKKEFA